MNTYRSLFLRLYIKRFSFNIFLFLILWRKYKNFYLFRFIFSCINERENQFNQVINVILIFQDDYYTNFKISLLLKIEIFLYNSKEFFSRKFFLSMSKWGFFIWCLNLKIAHILPKIWTAYSNVNEMLI